MELTNKHCLPDSLVRAAEKIFGAYNRGNADFSCSDLLRPPMQFRLLRDHEHELVKDVADVMPQLLGSALHYVLQQGEGSEDIAESRFFAKYRDNVMLYDRVMSKLKSEWTVSTKPDLFIDNTKKLIDNKHTKCWSMLFPDARQKWEEQLNVQADIIRRNGGEVTSVENLLFFKDWQRDGKARKGEWYPESEIMVLEQPLWSPEDAHFFIIKRCIELQEAIDAPTIADVAECDAADRWERGEQWAVKKEGLKKAIKVYDLAPPAHVVAALEKDKCTIEHRSATCNRCLYACDVAQWCPTWERIQIINPEVVSDRESP